MSTTQKDESTGAPRPPRSPRPQESTGRRIIKNLRWYIVVWLLLAAVVNYMDRSVLSIAAPELIDDLGFTKTDIGLLGTVFSWTYAVCQLPAGWLIDKLGAKRLYWMAVGFWSLATLLMSFGTTLWYFITMRFFLGIGESPVSPTAAKITSQWFPRVERGQATSVWDSGSKWGPAIAPPILTAIMIGFGWQSMFVFLGILGLILAAAFFAFYRTPEESRHLGEDEFAKIRAGRDDPNAPQVKLPWLSLFKHRQIWGMIFGYFCIIWIWNLFITFIPLFLQDTHGVSIAETGIYAAIPFVGAALLEFVGGYSTKKLQQRTGISSLAAKRRVMIVIVLLGGIVVCIVPFSPNLLIALVTLTIGLGFIAMSQGVAWSLPGEIVPDSHVARVGSIQNFGGYFGGAFAPLVTGILVDRTGSYTSSLVIGGVILACAGIFYGLLVRKPIATQRVEAAVAE